MVAKLAGAVVMAALLAGCSIRVQAPIREVAYDFSDRDFYDRAYAPSPVYAEPSASAPVYAEPSASAR
jgi:hypothetical protein